MDIVERHEEPRKSTVRIGEQAGKGSELPLVLVRLGGPVCPKLPWPRKPPNSLTSGLALTLTSSSEMQEKYHEPLCI